MKVLKFGGTSVGSSSSIRSVKEIVESQTDSVVVVVSALGGVTDLLIRASKMAETGNSECFDLYSEVKERHYNMITSLFDQDEAKTIKYQVDQLFEEVNTILKGYIC